LAESDEIVVDSQDVNREARENMWVFSPRDDQLGRIDADTVMRFLNEIIRSRRADPSDNAAPEMDFYCWHDHQARQLRFSLVSSSHGCLPFACAIKEVGLLGIVDSVVHDWLNPSWGEEDDSAGTGLPVDLPVFVLKLRACS
jgi:hypothetical protein